MFSKNSDVFFEKVLCMQMFADISRCQGVHAVRSAVVAKGGGVIAAVRRGLRRCKRRKAGQGPCGSVCGFAGSSSGWPVGSPGSVVGVVLTRLMIDGQ